MGILSSLSSELIWNGIGRSVVNESGILILAVTGISQTPTQVSGSSFLTTGEQTRHIYPIFDQCRANVVDGGPTLVKHWLDVSCACLESRRSRVRTLPWHSSFNIISILVSVVNIQYSGDPPWSRRSGLGLYILAWISNLVSGGQCHLIHLTILARFSRASLTYLCKIHCNHASPRLDILKWQLPYLLYRYVLLVTPTQKLETRWWGFSWHTWQAIWCGMRGMFRISGVIIRQGGSRLLSCINCP